MTTTNRPRRARPLRATRRVGRAATLDLTVELTAVTEALAELDGRFLDCRDMRHSWDKDGFWREGGVVKRRLSCARCGTERTDTWTADGKIRLSVKYKHPEGYLFKDVDGRANGFDVRSEVVSRATVFNSEHEMVRALMRRNTRRNGKVTKR